MIPVPVVRLALRIAAIMVAIAGVADPTLSINRVPTRQVMVVTAVDGDASAVRADLGVALADVDLQDRQPRGAALPCGPDDTCLVIADGSVDLHDGAIRRAPVFMVKVGPAAGPNVELSSAFVSPRQHAAAAGSVHVVLSGAGVSGRTTNVRVLDGSVVVGTASHEWSADGPAELEVTWWAMGEGTRALRVEAVPVEGEIASFDNFIEAAATLHDAPTAVLVFDPRPSWSSTFVRHALEDDPRFAVRSRARLGPALTAGTPSSALDAATLQGADLVVVGAPDALDAGEVALLERYLRVRGGTLVLLPDRLPFGAAARLFPGEWTEHLAPTAESIGPLRASEVLRQRTVGATDVVLGTSRGLPAIVMSPAGAGHVVVVGAMDAWRFRDAADRAAFDRFWRALAVEGGARGKETTVDLADSLVAAASTVPFNVRVRSMQGRSAIAVRAAARCDDGPPQMIRLWPDGEEGAFSGSWPVGGGSGCELEVAAADGPAVNAAVRVVRAPARGTRASFARLERLVAATGGLSVPAGSEQVIGDAMRHSELAAVRTAVHPMRSPWWILPFAACLAGEWWLRRRDGLR